MENLTGAETYARLTPWQRDQFDAEWRELLYIAERDFDVEPLVRMVCRWWLTSGGDTETARATLLDFQERSSRRSVTAVGVSGGSTVPLRGPDVFSALGEPERVRMEEAWQAAILDAGESRDFGRLAGVVLTWWVELRTTEEDRAMLAGEVRCVEAAVAAGDFSGLTVWEPSH